MRIAAAFALLFTTTALLAGEVSFVRVWPEWRDAQSFERIGEFFGGPEGSGRETILRTQPGTRDGYYFLVRTKTAGAAPAGSRFELSVIRPDMPEPKTYSFPADIGTGQKVFQLGLTGADWPGGKDAHPVAWRLAFVGPDQRVLAEQKSFLWEKPAK